MLLTDHLNLSELPVALVGNHLRIGLLVFALLLGIIVVWRLRRQKLAIQPNISSALGIGPIQQQKSGLFAAPQFADRLSRQQRTELDAEDTSKPRVGYALDFDNEVTSVTPPQADRLIVGYLVRVTSEPRLPAKLTIYGTSSLFSAECQIAIGRHRKHNTVVISDKSVSREHAVIVRRAEQLFIRDKGSSAGTLLNWKRLASDEELPLRHNDILAFGETVYEFCIQPIDRKIG